MINQSKEANPNPSQTQPPSQPHNEKFLASSKQEYIRLKVDF